MDGVEPPRQPLQHLVIRTALAGWLDQFGPDGDVLMATTVVKIIMLHEDGGRKHDIRHLRGFGHELLMNDHEQVFTRKALAYQRLLRRNRHRIGVLDQHRLDRATSVQRLRIASQNAPDLGLIEYPNA